ncbi:MAG: methyltransferase domain-containing protein [Caldilineaceae bacterium]|nr:methyltransferase domain-containing protein [Caldilineaceae bacterium]
MTQSETSVQANEITRTAWNTNAAYWDARMGDTGNDFVNGLIWPMAKVLLDLQAGERVLDVGCGNGLYARRMAALGAQVDAFDFAEEMISLARGYPSDHADKLTYHVLDATDEAALLTLGTQQFDAALSTMALMDIADIDPLFRTLAQLLKPGGRFVFATAHPCFNSARCTHVIETADRDGNLESHFSIKSSGYMTPATAQGIAIKGQPLPQLYFDRPLHLLLASGFQTGFVVDALEERAFMPDERKTNNSLWWGDQFGEFPPVLIVRMRRLQQ